MNSRVKELNIIQMTEANDRFLWILLKNSKTLRAENLGKIDLSLMSWVNMTPKATVDLVTHFHCVATATPFN